MTPPPILGQDDLIECLRWAAFKMYGAGEHETFASDAISTAIYHIEDLHTALANLLHAVCGEKGFAEAVRRDSGRIYPWPALELAEAKARKVLEQSK